jgi:hypothetical protein
MTIPKLTDLTDEEINVLIAEACGWRFNEHWANPPGTTSWIPLSATAEVLHRAGMPRYTSDLNAMHLAEKALTGGLKAGSTMYRYTRALHDLMCGMGHLATAKQRACAFLLAIGKAGL